MKVFTWYVKPNIIVNINTFKQPFPIGIQNINPHQRGITLFQGTTLLYFFYSMQTCYYHNPPNISIHYPYFTILKVKTKCSCNPKNSIVFVNHDFIACEGCHQVFGLAHESINTVGHPNPKLTNLMFQNMDKYFLYVPQDVVGMAITLSPINLLETVGCHHTYIGPNGLEPNFLIFFPSTKYFCDMVRIHEYVFMLIVRPCMCL